MSTKKVPRITAAAGALWASFVSAVDEVVLQQVARTPPGRIHLDICVQRAAISGYGCPGQIASLVIFFGWTIAT